MCIHVPTVYMYMCIHCKCTCPYKCTCFLQRVVYSTLYVQYVHVHVYMLAHFMSFLLSTVHQYLFELFPRSPVQAEVRTLTNQLESVKQDLLSEKHKKATASPADGPSGQGERLVTLEMKELNERQRADLATTR